MKKKSRRYGHRREQNPLLSSEMYRSVFVTQMQVMMARWGGLGGGGGGGGVIQLASLQLPHPHFDVGHTRDKTFGFKTSGFIVSMKIIKDYQKVRSFFLIIRTETSPLSLIAYPTTGFVTFCYILYVLPVISMCIFCCC